MRVLTNILPFLVVFGLSLSVSAASYSLLSDVPWPFAKQCSFSLKGIEGSWVTTRVKRTKYFDFTKFVDALTGESHIKIQELNFKGQVKAEGIVTYKPGYKSVSGVMSNLRSSRRKAVGYRLRIAFFASEKVSEKGNKYASCARDAVVVAIKILPLIESNKKKRRTIVLEKLEDEI